MGKMHGIAAFGALLVVGTTQVPSLGATPTRIAQDTTRVTSPLHFRKTAFFDTKYLHRAADVAMERYRGDAPEATAPRDDPKPEPRADEPRKKAETLGKRYGVARELAQKIVDMALAEGIDPELGFRMIRVESGFKPTARGPQGAAGLLQLMPSTARTVDRSVDTRSELLDPQTNLRVGFRYLRQLIERYDGDVRLGVLAYNRGENAVDRALKSGRDPENGYSHKVLGTRGGTPYAGGGLVKKETAPKRTEEKPTPEAPAPARTSTAKPTAATTSSAKPAAAKSPAAKSSGKATAAKTTTAKTTAKKPTAAKSKS